MEYTLRDTWWRTPWRTQGYSRSCPPLCPPKVSYKVPSGGSSTGILRGVLHGVVQVVLQGVLRCPPGVSSEGVLRRCPTGCPPRVSSKVSARCPPWRTPSPFYLFIKNFFHSSGTLKHACKFKKKFSLKKISNVVVLYDYRYFSWCSQRMEKPYS
jgi:hypothetical protein